VVVEQRDVDADPGPRVEVEEAHVAVQLGVARVEPVALGQHHPAPRAEAWVDDAATARGGRAGSPGGADSSEPDVVHDVGGQQARRDQANQIIRKRRRPGRRRRRRRRHIDTVGAASGAAILNLNLAVS